MFARVKKASPFRYPGDQEVWTHRGDKFCKVDPQPDKMLRYLLGIVKNRWHEHYIFQLHDNSIPAKENESLILHVLNGIVKQNFIPNYGDLLVDFFLPPDLAYTVNPYENETKA